MIVSEIHKAFKVLMDKNAEAVSMGGCPAFLPEEIDLFLNQAYNEIIINKYTGNNPTQMPFEGNAKRLSEFSKLIKTDTNIEANLIANSNMVTCLFANVSDSSSITINKRLIFISCELLFGDNSLSKAQCTLVNHNDFRRFVQSYNNRPWIDTPVVTIDEDRLRICVDTDIMKAPYKVNLTYLKPPMKIDYKTNRDLSLEINDAVVYEIINRAVLIALENIESQRSQTKTQLNTLSE